MDLDDVGARCALSACATLDYLPMRCSHCTQQFCAAHHGAAAHACSAAPAAPHVPTCPICARPVPPAPGQPPDDAMARHIDAGCPRRARNNKLCSKHECRTRDVTPVLCRACGLNFCLEHRLEADHDCGAKGPVPSKSDAPLAAAMRRLAASDPTATAAASGGGGGEGGGGGGGGGGGSRKKRMLFSRKGRSKSRPPAGAVAGGAGSSSSSMVFSNSPSNPRRVAGAAAMDAEDVLHLAVYFAPHIARRPEFWVVSRRWSAGKVMDGLHLPAMEGSARYGLYGVRRSGGRVVGVNLLPRIAPLRDGGGAVRDGDAVVVEVGESGLPPGWIGVLGGDPALGQLRADRVQGVDGRSRATKSKCVVA
jgi:predicted nucleic acid binding AN1-type Zn finger protein